jgi:redox-sensitive bicupin YhaK (pirin superfamily)
MDLLLKPHVKDLGGFSVRRLLPAQAMRTIGPFIFFDHMGPAAFAPGDGIDVRPHPHIGLATVTYLFDGALMHRDSLGFVQRIEPGAVNWMTAGDGIVHSERSDPADRAAVMHQQRGFLALDQPAQHGLNRVEVARELAGERVEGEEFRRIAHQARQVVQRRRADVHQRSA